MPDERTGGDGRPVPDAGRQRVYCRSADGLRLGGREWGHPGRTPVVCLAGLTRNARDFQALAEFLASGAGGNHHVIALDYRGRGTSDRDPDWTHYNLTIEQADIHAALQTAGIRRAHFIGTSRGGLHSLLLGQSHPELVASVVLNDVGPVIESDGLQRIARTVDLNAHHDDWQAAARALNRNQKTAFPTLSESDWLRLARQLMIETERGIAADCDPGVLTPVAQIDFTRPLPTLWETFLAQKAPCLLIRGGLSDLLSAKTVGAMRRAKPDLRYLEIPLQGHAPLLWDAATHRVIGTFLNSV